MSMPMVNYQDFGAPGPAQMTAQQISDDAEEEAHLQTFEKGYQAGWEDAVKAQRGLENTVSSELAKNLQEASFQYHEIRGQMTRSLHEIMQGIVDVALPEIAQRSLGVHVLQMVDSHIARQLDQTVQLCVAPSSVDVVEQLMTNAPVSYTVAADPALTPEQANICIGETEHSIDLAHVLAEIRAAVAAYFETEIVEEKND